MRTDRRGEEGAVIRERRGERLRFRAATEGSSKGKHAPFQQLSGSHPGQRHISLRRSGASHVRDELVAAHTDVRVKGSGGIPGTSDVTFTDRLLCVQKSKEKPNEEFRCLSGVLF